MLKKKKKRKRKKCNPPRGTFGPPRVGRAGVCRVRPPRDPARAFPQHLWRRPRAHAGRASCPQPGPARGAGSRRTWAAALGRTARGRHLGDRHRSRGCLLLPWLRQRNQASERDELGKPSRKQLKKGGGGRAARSEKGFLPAPRGHTPVVLFSGLSPDGRNVVPRCRMFL